MANGFDYESPLNRLLSITVPQTINRALDRQESSRRFDREMDMKDEQLSQAQDNFDEQLEITKEQNKFNREQTLKAEDRADDKLIIDDIFNFLKFSKISTNYFNHFEKICLTILIMFDLTYHPTFYTAIDRSRRALQLCSGGRGLRSTGTWCFMEIFENFFDF